MTFLYEEGCGGGDWGDSSSSVQIRSFFWSILPSFGMNTKYVSVFSLNAGKYVPEKAPYLDTFHAVHPIPNKAWTKIAVDPLRLYRHYYLLMTNCYSKFIVTKFLKK